MRGWAWRIHLWRSLLWVFPAHAGVSLRIQVHAFLLRRIPCTCGGEPDAEKHKKQEILYSLHMRGWAWPTLPRWLNLLVFPAHAGVSPKNDINTGDVVCIPCTCGGEPKGYSEAGASITYSLHMRGWASICSQIGAALEVFPAHAGVSPVASDLSDFLHRIPCTCGGEPLLRTFKALSFLYSLHMRGWA